MSIRVMAMVWDSAPVAGSDLLALLALADWSDDSGRSFPSVAAVAKKVRLSRSQTQRVLHSLIECGLLAVEGNQNGGHPGASRRYRIAMERLTGRASATGSAGATGVVDAQDGSHPCAQTGSTDATLYVNEPPKYRQREAPRSPRGSRLSAEWVLPDDWKAWAQQERPDISDPAIRRIADSFKDFWLSKPGKDGTKLDWPAVWRNWIRRERKSNSQPQNQHQQFNNTDYGSGGEL